MPNPSQPSKLPARLARRHRQWRGNLRAVLEPVADHAVIAEIDVGRRLRELRNGQGLSIRSLAEMSGLNFNTLSLIENGKTSPSVSTLQQLALALQVPISSFFETEPPQKSIVYQKAGQRPRAAFPTGCWKTWERG